MKTINFRCKAAFFIIGVFLSLSLVQCSSSKKIEKPTATDIQDMVVSSRFVFVADRVMPMRAPTKVLTSSYDVVIKKDTLKCYLPYFGRAQMAPMDPSKNGMQFNSYNFEYTVNQKGNDQWEVIIKPRDYTDVQQLYFTVFSNGNATLNVTNINKDPISYDGHIEKVKK